MGVHDSIRNLEQLLSSFNRELSGINAQIRRKEELEESIPKVEHAISLLREIAPPIEDEE